MRQIKVAEGIFAGLFGLAFSWVIIFTADRFVDTPAQLRAVILLAGALGFGFYFPLKCHRWVWGTRSMRQVAGLLSHRFPLLGDQVLGIVELASGERELGDSRILAVAAIEQVDSVVRQTNFHQAVPRPRHLRWGIAAGVPLLLLLLAVAVVPDAAWNSLGRWVMPWREINRYTFAQIERLPDEMVVPHGEDFNLSARLTDQTKWSPESGRVQISGKQNVEAQRTDRDYEFAIPPQTDSGAIKIQIGDVRESVEVQPVPRPELTAMTATVTLPDYLQYSRALTQDVRSGAVSLLKGSLVRFAAEVSRSLASASLAGESVRTQGNRILTDLQPVDETVVLRLEWTDELGLSSRRPFPVNIRAVDDAEPGIGWVQEDPLHVVLSTDVIRFSLTADDDFGVRAVGLEWSGIHHSVHNPNPDTGNKVVTTGGPEQKSLSVQTTFCASSDQVRPQSLKMRAWAEDYKPERGRIYSSAFVLHVLTPEDHAMWLGQQLRRWASRADDVYEQETRLHDVNREMRRMPADELLSIEMQRQIRQQAAAELSNAERLAQLTEQGDRLIRQVMRNPQMLVGHLETFAQALKQLRDIAGCRMPSVADLLSDAAQAEKKQVVKSVNASPEEDNERAPFAGNNRGNQSGQSKPPAKNSQPPVPALVDVESGFNPDNPPIDEEKGKPSESGKGQFGRPVTTLQGGPGGEKKKKLPSANRKVDQAVEEQANLLAEFEKVREEVQKIMDDLENSTFVKRFKAASRRQLDVAADLNRTLFKGFGLDQNQLEEHQTAQVDRIAVCEEEESRVIWTIRSDMQAYYGRRKEEEFRRIAQEMDELNIVTELGSLGNRVRRNLSGDSISRVEFWADTLDRWAEELVLPSKCGSCKACSSDSLPPAIVLEVMRILEGEIDLRDETRSLETSRTALAHQEYEDSAARLFETQIQLHERTLTVKDDIRALPEGRARFSKELKIIGLAAVAMKDAAELLCQPSTGPGVIAAETESIELLLQSKRVNPNGGGGGGGATPGGGGAGDTSTPALALHGPGSDPNAHIEAREIRQMTGTSGERLPEEFRDGLEVFFNAVEYGN